MSRSGYDDDGEHVQLWRGAVASAIRGRRGQAFLIEMRDALDAMPVKRLIRCELEDLSGVCAIGAVGRKRGLDMQHIDPHDPDTIAGQFGIAMVMVCEIEFENDENGRRDETPEQRFDRMRAWAASHIALQQPDRDRQEHPEHPGDAAEPG